MVSAKGETSSCCSLDFVKEDLRFAVLICNWGKSPVHRAGCMVAIEISAKAFLERRDCLLEGMEWMMFCTWKQGL
jgi:hypothetical protein